MAALGEYTVEREERDLENTREELNNYRMQQNLSSIYNSQYSAGTLQVEEPRLPEFFKVEDDILKYCQTLMQCLVRSDPPLLQNLFRYAKV